MRAKLTLLAIIVGHLGALCVATFYPVSRCEDLSPWSRHHRLCTPRRMPTIDACFDFDRLCSEFLDFRDCLLPQFKCVGNGRCIPRSFYCDGTRNCMDGSDEWGCDTTSADSPTTESTMVSESVEDTSSYIMATPTMVRDNEDKTTNVIVPESEENISSSSTIKSTTLSHSESNTGPSSSTTTSTILPDSESNTTVPSSTTTSMESNTTIPSSTTTRTESDTARPSSTTTSTESDTAIPSSTTSTRLPDSEMSTAPSTSTTASTMFLNSESHTDAPTSSPTKTIIPDSEANTSLPSFVTDSTMLPESEEKTSYPTTNSIFSDSSVMQPCPDYHCMQNAECVVVGNQYRCKCPPSFIGKLCEVQLGTEQVSHEYVVAIVILVTLVILCSAVVSVGIYRYKRLSAWKSNDVTSRTLSQLTLTSNDVEEASVSMVY